MRKEFDPIHLYHRNSYAHGLFFIDDNIYIQWQSHFLRLVVATAHIKYVDQKSSRSPAFDVSAQFSIAASRLVPLFFLVPNGFRARYVTARL